MRNFLNILAAADKVLTAILKTITIALFVALTLIVTANILLRLFPVTSLHWLDEIVEMCFAALVFYGAAGVWMVKGHFSIGDWIGKRIHNERARNGYKLLLEMVTLLFAGVLFFYSLSLTFRAREVTAVFQISKKVLYSCIPISCLIMIVYSGISVIRAAIGVMNPDALAALEPGPKPKLHS